MWETHVRVLNQDKVKSQSASPEPPTPKKEVSSGKTSRPTSAARKTPEPASVSNAKTPKIAEGSKKVSKETSAEGSKKVSKETSAEAKQKSEEKPNAPKKSKEVKILPKQKATEGSSDIADNVSDLSALDKDTHTETTTAAQHEKQLENSVKTEVAKGNMLKKPNIKLLHYEDPRIIQLKLTDVSKRHFLLFTAIR